MNLNSLLHAAIAELQSAGFNTPQLDAKVLLKHVLNNDDVYLLTHSEAVLSNAQYQKFRRFIRRRKQGEPIAYITGRKEFYGFDFNVNKNVLIPRPETEILVENSLNFLGERLKVKGDSNEINAIDIGTGSGCIMVSLAMYLFAAPLYPLKPVTLPTGDPPSGGCHLSPALFASDICPKALAIAKQNARKHQVYDNIRFYKSDLFSNKRLPKKFQLVIANLPYLEKRDANYPIKAAELGLKFEPKSALYAEEQGFELIDKLIKQLPNKLSSQGIALIEANDSHHQKIVDLCLKQGLKAEIIKNPSKFKGFFKICR